MRKGEQARAAYEEARTIGERAVLDSPDEPARHMMVLALIYRRLGP